MKLISDILDPGQKPSINQLMDEIDMVFMQPISTAYDILASDELDDGSAENLLYVTLGHWKRFSEDIAQCFEKEAS